MTDKLLSETHPTFWNACLSSIKKFVALRKVDKILIQSCTVDIAKHERLKKELEDAYHSRAVETDEAWKRGYHSRAVETDEAWKRGIAEGERRAMERIYKAYPRLNWLAGFMVGVTDPQFSNGKGHNEAKELVEAIKEFGLDKKEEER